MRLATGIAAQAADTVPHSGALTLCDQCFAWLVFTDTLALRFATIAEIESIDPELQQLARELGARISLFGKRPH